MLDPLFVFGLQLEQEQNGNHVSFFFPLTASYRNREAWGGGVVCTPGDVKTDSALCALIGSTIKNHYKPAFITVSQFLFLCLLRHGFPFYFLACVTASARALETNEAARTPVPK